MQKSKRSPLFYGWVVVAVASVNLGLAYGVWYSFTVFFVAVLQDYGWGRGDTALAFSVFVSTHGLSSPVLGLLCERWGVRRVVIAGSVFLGLALAACSQVTAPWQYYLAFGVATAIGVHASGVLPNVVAINAWFVKKRGFAVGIAFAGIGAIGIAIMVPLNTFLIAQIGWRTSYLVLAGAVLLILPALNFFLMRGRPQEIGLRPDGVPAEEAPSRPASSGGEPKSLREAPEWTLGRAIRTRRFWALGLAFAMAPITHQMVFVHQVAYMIDLGHGAVLAAGVASLIGIVSIPSKIGWGELSDRLGREIVYWIGIVLTVIAIALLIAMPVAAGTWTLYAFAFAFGTGYAVQASINPSIAGDIFTGAKFAVIYGVLQAMANVGGAFGPWLAGYIFDVQGSYAVAFVVSIGTAIISGVAVWIAAPRHARPIGPWFTKRKQAVVRVRQEG